MFNMGSTWYGDSRKIRNLAKLTVALNKYGRAQMFGPGTTCRYRVSQIIFLFNDNEHKV